MTDLTPRRLQERHQEIARRGAELRADVEHWNRTHRLYRPSNGTEGDDFTRQFCERCVHDRKWREHGRDPCGINMAAMCFEVDEPGFPPEWRYGDDGQPTCSAFEFDPESLDPGPLRIASGAKLLTQCAAPAAQEEE